MQKAIKKYLTEKGKKFLDYGCGDIPYKSLFERHISEYIACDIGGNRHADVEIGLDSSIPMSNESVDVVLSIQVLEHVQDVQNYLKEANRILRPEGLMLLSTHGWWTHHPYPVDLRRWTFEGLAYELEKNGFRVIESAWVIGMLAYSCQLRLQCFKGILENRGKVAIFVLNIISTIYQILMFFADKITPQYIAQNNAAVYFVVASKADRT